MAFARAKEKELVFQYNSAAGNITAEHNKEIKQKLGAPPWEKINAAFQKHNVAFTVNFPQSDTVPFQCKFTDPQGNVIDFADLSSGERMIVTLILWAYNEQIGALNSLFLMDEPDAHLHPSMSQLFIKIVSETLVTDYGIQIIMTTHNPSTLALLPEDSIFIMNKSGQERVKKASKREALPLLTENLLLVTASFRILLVEDQNDVLFYQTVYEALMTSSHIKKSPPLVFKPASIGSGGGKKVVQSWVKKLNEATPAGSTLDHFVCGLNTIGFFFRL